MANLNQTSPEGAPFLLGDDPILKAAIETNGVAHCMSILAIKYATNYQTTIHKMKERCAQWLLALVIWCCIYTPQLEAADLLHVVKDLRDSEATTLFSIVYTRLGLDTVAVDNSPAELHRIVDEHKPSALVVDSAWLKSVTKIPKYDIPVLVLCNNSSELRENWVEGKQSTNLLNLKIAWQEGRANVIRRELFFRPKVAIRMIKAFQNIFGERCWHSPGYYANLTIDDPWLTERYGNLDFEALAADMERRNYHTTIALIPWNYDRSEQEVIRIFKKYSDRLSICIHGNNHNHREFYKYEAGPYDPWPSAPLDEQEKDIAQAILRMDIFQKLTGIPYDRVMVFPHGISPAKTLGLLKKHGFTMTTNQGNVPLGKLPPIDKPEFLMHTVVTDFQKFASVDRFHMDRDQTVELQLSLGNPIIYFAHHYDFRKNTGRFAKTVERLQVICPQLEWVSLGDMAKRLFRQRWRESGHMEICALSPVIQIDNNKIKPIKYVIIKEETGDPEVEKVYLNDKPVEYELAEEQLRIETVIAPNETAHISIHYKNEYDYSSVTVHRDDIMANRLRKLSDFRDLVLPHIPLGPQFTDFYYGSGAYRLGFNRLAIICLASIMAFMVLVVFFRRRWQCYRKEKV